MKSLLTDPFFIAAITYTMFFFISRFYRTFRKKNTGPSTLRMRFRAAWKIVTGRHHRWVLVSVSDNALARACAGQLYAYSIEWCGLEDYPRFYILKQVANTKSDVDMVILKAQYEAAVEEFMVKKADAENKKNNPQ